MKIAKKYSHLNGEEYLIVHKQSLYEELTAVIEAIDAEVCRTKVSKEKRKGERTLYSPIAINTSFKEKFSGLNWHESRYSYYITLDRTLMEKTIGLTIAEQREYLKQNGEPNPIYSYNQTDFVKDEIAIEVQFGKYPFVAYDLFVKLYS